MFTVKDFIIKFERYSDEQLIEIHANWNHYSKEAQQAFNVVVDQKGGTERLLHLQAENQRMANEAHKIRITVAEFTTAGSDLSFIKNMVTSDVLPQEEVDGLIESAYYTTTREKEDVEIKPRTIYGSIFGTFLAGCTGGILWGVHLVYSARIFLIFILALAAFCYFIIKAFTRQSKKNTVVLLATIAAVGLALLVGEIIFEVVGYRGFSKTDF